MTQYQRLSRGNNVLRELLRNLKTTYWTVDTILVNDNSVIRMVRSNGVVTIELNELKPEQPEVTS